MATLTKHDRRGRREHSRRMSLRRDEVIGPRSDPERDLTPMQSQRIREDRAFEARFSAWFGERLRDTRPAAMKSELAELFWQFADPEPSAADEVDHHLWSVMHARDFRLWISAPEVTPGLVAEVVEHCEQGLPVLDDGDVPVNASNVMLIVRELVQWRAAKSFGYSTTWPLASWWPEPACGDLASRRQWWELREEAETFAAFRRWFGDTERDRRSAADLAAVGRLCDRFDADGEGLRETLLGCPEASPERVAAALEHCDGRAFSRLMPAMFEVCHMIAIWSARSYGLDVSWSALVPEVADPQQRGGQR